MEEGRLTDEDDRNDETLILEKIEGLKQDLKATFRMFQTD